MQVPHVNDIQQILHAEDVCLQHYNTAVIEVSDWESLAKADEPVHYCRLLKPVTFQDQTF